MEAVVEDGCVTSVQKMPGSVINSTLQAISVRYTHKMGRLQNTRRDLFLFNYDVWGNASPGALRGGRRLVETDETMPRLSAD